MVHLRCSVVFAVFVELVLLFCMVFVELVSLFFTVVVELDLLFTITENMFQLTLLI